MNDPGLGRADIVRLVSAYIGGTGGYLGDFSYRTHEEFYPVYCGLSINPYDFEGTTRQRFIKILESSPPDVQAKIIRGVLKKYPQGSSDQRTKDEYEHFRTLSDRLDGVAPVPSPAPTHTTDTVSRALSDAEVLLRQQGPTSAVDRIHTALHGYLMAVCDASQIAYPHEPSLTQLLKVLREKHPGFQNLGPREQDVLTVLRSSAAILDAFNPVRNRASVAHPNKELLDEPEAMLVINNWPLAIALLRCAP